MTVVETQKKQPITPENDLWQQLVNQGEAQGFVTFDDILTLMPALEHNIELLDELLDALGSVGIEVVPVLPTEPEHEEEPADQGAEEHENALDPSALYEDLVKDAGYQQALDTDDVVGLYLKEAGRVPLLTAEEEVALAKRMEAGKLAQRAASTNTAIVCPLDDVDTT